MQTRQARERTVEKQRWTTSGSDIKICVLPVKEDAY